MIELLVPSPPADPNPLALKAMKPSGLRQTLVEAYGSMRLDWRRGRQIQGQALREARHLGSSERRFAGDLLTFLVRHHRTIVTLVEQAGLSESATTKQLNLVRVLAALLLRGGGRPIDGPEFDYQAVTDPVHTLTGWARGRERAEILGVCASLPQWLADELALRDDAPELAGALNQRAPLVLRSNRAEVPTIEGTRPTEYAARGLVLEKRIDVNALPELRDGRLEVMDEGSQLVAEICMPQPGERILDLCAGALGKSLALAALAEDQAPITAFDVRRDAIRRGLKRAQRCGFRSIRPGNPKGGYDLVLIDAPCTGTGALRRRPWSRWSMTAREAAAFPKQQLEIAMRGAEHLKPGGRLIYATCSIRSSENGGVVDALRATRSDLSLVPLGEVIGADWAERIGADGVLTLEPHRHGTDGFYAAVLRRDG
ncbi:MAG: RsmB/NOP family class I SAM-dependent RNA methyltransferase [Proteobacteria bacterium]|nr:RsmB/NOP family class I SAM-dependent RNA methyltransferase [Pseudomonadota bacterium]